jgi:hypothetical protein
MMDQTEYDQQRQPLGDELMAIGKRIWDNVNRMSEIAQLRGYLRDQIKHVNKPTVSEVRLSPHVICLDIDGMREGYVNELMKLNVEKDMLERANIQLEETLSSRQKRLHKLDAAFYHPAVST